MHTETSCSRRAYCRSQLALIGSRYHREPHRKSSSKARSGSSSRASCHSFSACGLYSLELTLPDFIKKPHDLAASRLPAPSSCRLPHCCPQGPKSGPAIVTQGESNIKRRTDMHRKEAPALALCLDTPKAKLASAETQDSMCTSHPWFSPQACAHSLHKNCKTAAIIHSHLVPGDGCHALPLSFLLA